MSAWACIPLTVTNMKKIFFSLFFGFTAHAEIKIVTSTSTLADLAKTIGGSFVTVTSIAKGPQDPHYIEAKPSYMVLLKNADLFVTNGLDLEIGWLPNVIRGARNPNISEGGLGFLEAGSTITAIDIPEKVDRSQGDIHPKGNPHFLLDPLRAIQFTKALAERLSTLDPNHKADFVKNQKSFADLTEADLKKWKARVAATKIKALITYHKTLSYFLSSFDLRSADTIEPKPGIPPTPSHVIELQRKIRDEKIPCILVESFFETDSVSKLSKDTGIKYFVVPSEVESTKEAKSYRELIESLVSSVEKCAKT